METKALNKANTLRICAYPRDSLYCNLLYTALEKRGVDVLKGEIGFRWLIRNKRKIQFLHFHWPSFYYDGKRFHERHIKLIRFLFFLSLSKFLGIKIIWTAHNLYPHHAIKIKKFDRLARSLIVYYSTVIFAHGENSRQVIEEIFPHSRNKICVIDHGNYIGHYKNQINFSAAREKLGISDDYFVYLTLGACHPYKGIEDLIDSFRRIYTPKNKLIIAGRFPEKDYQNVVKEKIQRAGPARKGICLVDERIKDEDLQNYLNASNIMVLPYKYGSILTSGIALLSLSFGLPVIAPCLGNFKDIIEHGKNGLIYSPDPNLENLTHAMKQIRTIPFSRSSIIENTKKYNWDETAATVSNELRKNLIQR